MPWQTFPTSQSLPPKSWPRGQLFLRGWVLQEAADDGRQSFLSDSASKNGTEQFSGNVRGAEELRPAEIDGDVSYAGAMKCRGNVPPGHRNTGFLAGAEIDPAR